VSGLEGLHDGDDRGGLDPVTLPASDLEGNPWRSTSRPTMTWGSTLLSLPVTHPPQVILMLGLEVERGHACRHRDSPLVAVTCSNRA